MTFSAKEDILKSRINVPGRIQEKSEERANRKWDVGFFDIVTAVKDRMLDSGEPVGSRWGAGGEPVGVVGQRRMFAVSLFGDCEVLRKRKWIGRYIPCRW